MTNPRDLTEPNPVPPHRRGLYKFHPTPKISPRGTPILANQESDQAPFRTDSALAAVPLRLPDLSDQQIHAIQLTLDGYTDGSIARIVKINRSTLWRWKNFHPLFKAELSRRRHEAWSAAGDRFRRILFSALKHIRRQLEDTNAATSFRAARLLLNLAGANRFAPPDEPTDPQSYLDTFAIARRKEIHSPNLESDPAHDSERESALATLLAKCEDPNLPPPGMQPDPPTIHSLGDDGQTGAAHRESD
ncbi:MAG TPA: hypothetical protein VGP94_07095 [Tepidisphaeraceae bacterium]|nr:hypothetical protein [Tepidisphaeraceae bacterium]